MSYQALKDALGIDDGSAKVYRVAFIRDSQARLELNGAALTVAYNGGYYVGDRVVVRGGNVESVVTNPQTYYID